MRLPRAFVLFITLSLTIGWLNIDVRGSGNAVNSSPQSNSQADENNKALLEAISSHNTERVKALLANGADANTKNKNGYSALFSSITTNNIEVTKMLIKAGADVKAVDKNGETVLPFAVAWPGRGFNTVEFIKLLIAAGANVNAQNRAGVSALLQAANRDSENYLDILKTLVAAGANVDCRDNYGRTALMNAVLNNRWDAVALLKSEKTDLLGRDITGNTILMLAINRYSKSPIYQATNFESMTKLLLAGVDVNARNNQGETALMLAAKNGTTPAIETILVAGADVNAVNNNGETALIYALKYGGWSEPIENVNALIAAGADIKIVDKAGNSAQSIITEHHYAQLKSIIK